MCLSICFGARVEVEKSVSSRRCLPLLFWTRCEVGACGNDPQSRFRYLGLTCLACGNYSQSRTRPAKVAGRTNAFIACAEVFFSWTRLVGEWTGLPALVEQFVLTTFNSYNHKFTLENSIGNSLGKICGLAHVICFRKPTSLAEVINECLRNSVTVDLVV